MADTNKFFGPKGIKTLWSNVKNLVDEKSKKDWNQNDEAAPDYIQNRTHNYVGSKEIVHPGIDLINKTTMVADWNKSNDKYTMDIPGQLIDGQTYDISFNIPEQMRTVEDLTSNVNIEGQSSLMPLGVYKYKFIYPIFDGGGYGYDNSDGRIVLDKSSMNVKFVFSCGGETREYNYELNGTFEDIGSNYNQTIYLFNCNIIHNDGSNSPGFPLDGTMCLAIYEDNLIPNMLYLDIHINDEEYSKILNYFGSKYGEDVMMSLTVNDEVWFERNISNEDQLHVDTSNEDPRVSSMDANIESDNITIQYNGELLSYKKYSVDNGYTILNIYSSIHAEPTVDTDNDEVYVTYSKYNPFIIVDTINLIGYNMVLTMSKFLYKDDIETNIVEHADAVEGEGTVVCENSKISIPSIVCKYDEDSDGTYIESDVCGNNFDIKVTQHGYTEIVEEYNTIAPEYLDIHHEDIKNYHQPDWEQKNKKSLDYINNRTHYDDGDEDVETFHPGETIINDSDIDYSIYPDLIPDYYVNEIGYSEVDTLRFPSIPQDVEYTITSTLDRKVLIDITSDIYYVEDIFGSVLGSTGTVYDAITLQENELGADMLTSNMFQYAVDTTYTPKIKLKFDDELIEATLKSETLEIEIEEIVERLVFQYDEKVFNKPTMNISEGSININIDFKDGYTQGMIQIFATSIFTDPETGNQNVIPAAPILPPTLIFKPENRPQYNTCTLYDITSNDTIQTMHEADGSYIFEDTIYSSTPEYEEAEIKHAGKPMNVPFILSDIHEQEDFDVNIVIMDKTSSTPTITGYKLDDETIKYKYIEFNNNGYKLESEVYYIGAEPNFDMTSGTVLVDYSNYDYCYMTMIQCTKLNSTTINVTNSLLLNSDKISIPEDSQCSIMTIVHAPEQSIQLSKIVKPIESAPDLGDRWQDSFEHVLFKINPGEYLTYTNYYDYSTKGQDVTNTYGTNIYRDATLKRNDYVEHTIVKHIKQLDEKYIPTIDLNSDKVTNHRGRYVDAVGITAPHGDFVDVAAIVRSFPLVQIDMLNSFNIELYKISNEYKSLDTISGNFKMFVSLEEDTDTISGTIYDINTGVDVYRLNDNVTLIGASIEGYGDRNPLLFLVKQDTTLHAGETFTIEDSSWKMPEDLHLSTGIYEIKYAVPESILNIITSGSTPEQIARIKNYGMLWMQYYSSIEYIDRELIRLNNTAEINGWYDSPWYYRYDAAKPNTIYILTYETSRSGYEYLYLRRTTKIDDEYTIYFIAHYSGEVKFKDEYGDDYDISWVGDNTIEQGKKYVLSIKNYVAVLGEIKK